MTNAAAAAVEGVEIKGEMGPGYADILTPDALEFLADLQRQFGSRRDRLLNTRIERQKLIDDGRPFGFPSSTQDIRDGDWKVRPAPADLQDRRVEITGPVDRKMIINALNSGAKCFMADFEDASAPSWSNLMDGQINLRDAVRRDIAFEDPNSGKSYALNDTVATLIVRPRGWHLPEAHLCVDGAPMSGSLFDFGLYLFHNHAALKAIGSGPYFYLPKLEGAHEAALWADVFAFAEDQLGLERGTARATILIETLPASFELDEILYMMRDWIVGLNCGRWDYIFSYIKRLKAHSAYVLPDRSLVTMTAPFMRAYSLMVIETCHKRGAHAMGGMSAFIPVRGDDAANERAFAQLHADKLREAGDGHDGTWVAHPGMVAAAMEVFNAEMPGPNQLAKLNGYAASADELVAPAQGAITEAGLRGNASVGVQYVAAWLRGQGAVPINNLMEDAATAEIARAQLWQWRVHGASTDDGVRIDEARLEKIFDEEEAKIAAAVGEEAYDAGKYEDAARIVRDMALRDDFVEFLTLPAYDLIRTDR